MRLKRVRVQNYRSVEDSGWVDISDVTCLVGKNEAGKTAFLRALHRLNPTHGPERFDETMDYPSRHYAKYKRVKDESPAVAVEAEFELSGEDRAAVAALLGDGFLSTDTVAASKKYGTPNTRLDFQRNDEEAIAHLVAGIEAPEAAKEGLRATRSADELAHAIDQIEEPLSTATAVRAQLKAWGDDQFAFWRGAHAVLLARVPEFFYFDDYSVMPGRVSIPDLIRRRDANSLEEPDETFLRLLGMVGAKLEEFGDQSNFEALTRELEAAANGISADVFEYWKQNPDLEVSALVSAGEPDAKPPLNEGPVLNIRVRNPHHKVTVPFDERSKGFVWFFSFFAYFSEIEDGKDVILLLDEPGLSLHATAQRDFLDFIDGRLADNHQVIYTTHSPFMIPAGKLDRVRTVEDVTGEGTKVDSEVLRTDDATIFPLQAALGYDLAQTLFLGPDCLLVEGPSDLIYLQLWNQALAADGREPLSDRWVVTPAGGATNLTTFVSLLGSNQLNLAVLMDATRAETQKIRNLMSSGRLKARSIVRVSEFAGNNDADIEDLFESGFYVSLVNGAYSSELGAPLKVADIANGNPRIVRRIEDHFKVNELGRFNHYRPAAYFLTGQDKLLPKLSAKALDRAEALAKKLNGLLS